MTDNIFSAADQPPVEGTTTPPVSQGVVPPVPSAPVIPTELQEYVGAGKKYQTLDEVYKAFPHSQKHISTLESELATAREELTRRRTAEDLLNDIQNGITNKPVATTTESVAPTQDISAIVRQELEREKTASEHRLNGGLVKDAFVKLYGNDLASVEFNKIAASNGISVETLNTLALTSPNAVFKLAGIQPLKATHSGNIQNDVNPLTMKPAVADGSNIRVPKHHTTNDLVTAWRAAKPQNS